MSLQRLVRLALTLAGALILASPAVAQTGTITANPPGCHPEIGNTICSIQLSWSSQNAPNAVVRVVFESGQWGGYIHRSASHPGVTIPWISSTPRRFVLYAHDGTGAPELASTGFITAAPAQIRTSCNSCLLGGAGSCAIDLAWQAPHAPAGTRVRTLLEPGSSYGAWQHTAMTHPGLTIPWITTQQRRFVIVSPSGALLADTGIVQAESSSQATTTCRGGSNYQWFDIGTPQGGSCDRNPFGVLKAYGQNEGTIVSNLNTLYGDGQRVLRLGVHYSRNAATPQKAIVPVDANGRLYATEVQNLQRLLTKVHAAGFQEILFGFFAHGQSDPADSEVLESCSDSDCVALQEVIDEAKNLITQVRPLLLASGLAYRIDLRNEGIPVDPATAHPSIRPGAEKATAYAQQLWAWYASTYGTLDTVGFSISGDGVGNIRSRASNMVNVYGSVLPPVHQWHFYSRCSQDEGALFATADYEMSRRGIHGPMIIGETYYDDVDAANTLRSQIQSSPREVLFLVQWPQLRPTLQTDPQNPFGSQICALQCTSVSVAPPTSFGSYRNRGF